MAASKTNLFLKFVSCGFFYFLFLETGSVYSRAHPRKAREASPRKFTVCERVTVVTTPLGFTAVGPKGSPKQAPRQLKTRGARQVTAALPLTGGGRGAAGPAPSGHAVASAPSPSRPRSARRRVLRRLVATPLRAGPPRPAAPPLGGCSGGRRPPPAQWRGCRVSDVE